ncbi:MAG TPA: hypothetical protein VN611_11525 [Patescibacteria group bacterium]|nr:hypothetical protein [Patescibacteria group bacterium]
MVRWMKRETGSRPEEKAANLSRKVARRTIGLVGLQNLPVDSGWAFRRQSRGVKGLGLAVLLALAGSLLWWGMLHGGLALPEIAIVINEESRMTMGIFLVFVTVTLALIASLAAAMWLAVSIRKSYRIGNWPQADVQLPLKQLNLPFNSNGECRPRVEFEYVVNGDLYRSGRLPPLARMVREAEAETVRREFSRTRWASYNPEQIREAYLLIPPHYLNSLRHETVCLSFALLMTVLLSVALWFVADEIIPVLLRSV